MIEPLKPNEGQSVEAAHTMRRSESQAAFRKRLGIDPSTQIRLVRTSHMVYQHNDIDSIVTFLHDFGMRVAKQTEQKIWFKGYGPDPYVYVVEKGAEPKFLGGSFIVESFADLERAALLSGSSAIEKLDDAPGGGYQVTVFDPEGFPVNLLYGQEDDIEEGELEGNKSPFTSKFLYNHAKEKARWGAYQRFTKGPAAVYRLGHFGLVCKDFQRAFDFYVRTFNLVPSDVLVIPGEDQRDVAVGSFIHIDRGAYYTDHHSFFMTQGKGEHHVHHCSFEVHDFETQMVGHEWLEGKNYKLVWGVGRHLLGSQIFDYWWDTSGFMIEVSPAPRDKPKARDLMASTNAIRKHYADGDLVNSETPVSITDAQEEAKGGAWGPEVPAIFLD